MSQTMDQSTLNVLNSFYDYLLKGEVSPVLHGFASQPEINTPLQGSISGREDFGRYFQQTSNWLHEHQARIGLLATYQSADLMVAEFVLYLYLRGEHADLPVALSADLKSGKMSQLRMYHSNWPLTGTHLQRALSFTSTPNEVPPAVAAFFDCLKQGDSTGASNLFLPEGYLREPSGAKFKHTGNDAVKRYLGAALAQGGVQTQITRVLQDQSHISVEYVIQSQGGTAIKDQSALAVFELGPNGDAFAAVRIYDDFSTPAI
ncbi:nuclear transport factor 2 family protein [Pontibacter sp. G13]|uniref:nuclear transport factor 2 family protein n=1 Tax=Pontibacter sp. G13 TaxID=3074898 RepID=UPI002889A511|nr:nuclear transport factor 2 family protein [Pontibacter sp. G13]WNJ20232.1 nuclear transport factor 2 family protein [Pontibacter sp. G13]